MQLKEFSLISPVVESGTVLKALETAIPTEAITQAIADTHSNEERKRALPSHLVVCLVIAWVRVGQYWRVPCKSSITEARQRIGCGVSFRAQNSNSFSQSS